MEYVMSKVIGIGKKVLPFYLFTFLPLNIQAQRLSVTNATIDVGRTGYEMPVTATFELRNTGLRKLLIQEVKPDCSCTKVDYPRGEIGVGDKFTIRMTYDARQLGHFNKQAAVLSNGSKEPVYLTMTGIVLAEFNVKGSDAYRVPLFVPAITTTHEADISANNMMRPNLVRRQFTSEEEGDYTRFLLTNVHWTFSKGGTLSTEEADGAKIIETDAAGFYRHHLWKASAPEENAAKNTMTPNTAYLLVPTSRLPIAVWNSTAANARVIWPGTIGIRWIDEWDSTNGIRPTVTTEEDFGSSQNEWYSLDGLKLKGKPVKPGLYILRGRKVIVK